MGRKLKIPSCDLKKSKGRVGRKSRKTRRKSRSRKSRRKSRARRKSRKSHSRKARSRKTRRKSRKKYKINSRKKGKRKSRRSRRVKAKSRRKSRRVKSKTSLSRKKSCYCCEVQDNKMYCKKYTKCLQPVGKMERSNIRRTRKSKSRSRRKLRMYDPISIRRSTRLATTGGGGGSTTRRGGGGSTTRRGGGGTRGGGGGTSRGKGGGGGTSRGRGGGGGIQKPKKTTTVGSVSILEGGTGPFVYSKGGTTFTILTKFLLPDGTLEGHEFGKNVVKIQVNGNIASFLYLYTSQTSGGFWRIYIPGFKKLEDKTACWEKYGHYVQTTFVHLDLQNFINEHFESIPSEVGTPHVHIADPEQAVAASNSATSHMNKTSYPPEVLTGVLCGAIAEYPSLLGLSKSYAILNNNRHFKRQGYESNIYRSSLKSLPEEYIKNYDETITGYIPDGIWQEPVPKKMTKADRKSFGVGVGDDLDLLLNRSKAAAASAAAASSAAAAEEEKEEKVWSEVEKTKRQASLNVIFTYIDGLIKEKFTLIGSGVQPFTFIDNYNITGIVGEGVLYFEDFQSNEYEQQFRLYSIPGANILLVPLIDGDPPGINMFGGYAISIDPGLWVYKIADYIKQYPGFIKPIVPGANIGFTQIVPLPTIDEGMGGI